MVLLLPSSQISEKMYNTAVSNKFMMLKVSRSPTLCRYLQRIIEYKWHKQGSLMGPAPISLKISARIA
jgi:hypothetical protein